jgi:hypothetical protein
MTIKKQALIFCLVGGSLGYTSQADSVTRMYVLGGVQLGGAAVNGNETWEIKSKTSSMDHAGSTKVGKSVLSYGLDLGLAFDFGKVGLGLVGQVFWSQFDIKNTHSDRSGSRQMDMTARFKSNRANWAAVIRAAYALNKRVWPFIGFGYVWRPSQVSLFYADGYIFQSKKTFGGYSPRVGVVIPLHKSMHARFEGGVNYFKGHTFTPNTTFGKSVVSDSTWRLKPREVFLTLAFCYKLGMQI